MVVAAIITPADVLSMMAAAMPLVILYEMSIWMSIYVHRKLEKQEKALAKANNN
jgi:sec-independent protein translocase protein TatC